MQAQIRKELKEEWELKEEQLQEEGKLMEEKVDEELKECLREMQWEGWMLLAEPLDEEEWEHIAVVLDKAEMLDNDSDTLSDAWDPLNAMPELD